MLKFRNPIIIPLLSVLAASACDRLPISLGEGIDMLNDPRGSAGSSSTSMGGAPDGTDVGGGPMRDCATAYLLCLESGEMPELCRDELARCETVDPTTGTSAGYAGTGAGGYGSAGAPTDPTGTSAGHAGTGAGGYGSAGAPTDPTGAAGRGDGAAGTPGLDECEATYVLCLESGELVELCRAELSRCEPREMADGASN
jgi:hypothetical protein